MTRLTRVPPATAARARVHCLSQRDDDPALRARGAAAGLISPLASLTVSLTLCNFAALARVQTATPERRTFIELAAAEWPGVA